MRIRPLSYAAAAAICFGCATLGRQSEPADLPADGAPAVMFAPGIVSTGDVFASTFAPDGRTVVFTKFSPPKMTLFTSSFDGERWSAPKELPFSGTYRDLDPAFSPDGKRLYFSSWRPSSASPADTMNAADTWYVDRAGTGWSSPVRLPAPINHAETDMYPSLTRRGVLYFDSFRSVPKRRLVYRAEPRPDGSLGEPQLLDPVVNADSGASNLFVDPDEQYVVFGARRPEGVGDSDLYLSWRTPTGWTTPRNLGTLVNTPGVEFCPFVSHDGKFLYFTRIVTPSGGTAQRNVFVVRFDAMRDRLRP